MNSRGGSPSAATPATPPRYLPCTRRTYPLGSRQSAGLETELVSSNADERRGSHRANRLEHRVSLRCAVVSVRKLVQGEVHLLLRARARHQALAVHHEYFLARLHNRHARLLRHVLGNHLADAGARLARAGDEIGVLIHRVTRLGRRGDDSRERRRRDAVDVVVKDGRLRGVPLQQPLPVGVAEILKLHDAPLAETTLDGVDELVQELVVRLSRDAFHLVAHVQGIVQQLLVIGADVEAHGEHVGGIDAAHRRVQV